MQRKTSDEPVNATTTSLTIRVDGGNTVSGLLDAPPDPLALYVFAHGAGAGMDHAFMRAFADGLCGRRIASLRYQFPFMEHRTGRPDRPPLAQATVRAAVAYANEIATTLAPGLPLFAGGKSFGGRMTSQAQAAAPLAGVVGLVFVGFPLHPADKPSIERAVHLADVRCPMLFLQGTRDALAEMALLEPVVASLGPRATLHAIADADHAFHVRRSSGTTDERVLEAMLDATAAWMTEVRQTVPTA